MMGKPACSGSRIPVLRKADRRMVGCALDLDCIHALTTGWERGNFELNASIKS
jgi:hypothetical protein